MSHLEKFRKLKRAVGRSDFARSVATLMTGAAFAQAIPIFVSPILTRLYGPKAFGEFALYMSVVAIISTIATARYDLAIMLPETDDTASSLVVLAISSSVFVAFITLILSLALYLWWPCVLNLPTPRVYFYAPLLILFTAIPQTITAWVTRKKKFRVSALSRIAQAVGTVIANLICGFLGAGMEGLIIGGITGGFAALVVTSVASWSDLKYAFVNTRGAPLLTVAKSYRSFPLVNSLHALIDTGQASAVSMLISLFFGPTLLGYYSFTMRILRTPMTLIGSAISDVFYQRASSQYNASGNIKPLTKKMMGLLLVIWLPFLGLLMLAAPSLFKLVFGVAWAPSGEYARLLSPWIFFNFIVSPLSQIPLIVNRQKSVLALALVGNAIVLGSILLGGLVYHSLPAALILISLLECCYLAFVARWLYKIGDAPRELSAMTSGTLLNG